MPYIRETIITTVDRSGKVHIAPLGIIAEKDGWVIAPFRPSVTLDNLAAVPFAVANYTDDVAHLRRLPDRPQGLADRCRSRASRAAARGGARPFGAARSKASADDGVRPRHFCRVVQEETHAPFTGFNRAKAAVLELAILVSRLDMLPREKIEAEIAYLVHRHRQDRRPRGKEKPGAG